MLQKEKYSSIQLNRITYKKCTLIDDEGIILFVIIDEITHISVSKERYLAKLMRFPSSRMFVIVFVFLNKCAALT